MSGPRLVLVLLAVLALAAGWFGLSRLERGERTRESSPEEAESVAEPSPALLVPVEPASAPVERVEIEPSSPPEHGPDATAGEAVIRIHVVAKETGEGLAGISVALRAPRAIWRLEGKSAHGRAGETLLTDEQGWVEYAVPAGESWQLSVNTAPVREAGRVDQEVPACFADEERELVIELPTALDLVWFGRIFDGQTGAPLAGADVWSVTGSPFPAQPAPATVSSDPAGLVRLEHGSWATAHARVEHPGYSAGFVRLEARHGLIEQACEVPMFRAAVLDVRVTDAGGAPRGETRVAVSHDPWTRVLAPAWDAGGQKAELEEAKTDADGECSLEGLPPNVPITVELLDGERLLGRDELMLVPGERRARTWVVGAGCTIEGLVLEADGRAASDVEVWLRPHESNLYIHHSNPYLEGSKGAIAKTRSGEDGHFTLGDIAAGAWLIGPGPRQGEGSEAIAPAAIPLVVAPEDNRTSVTLTCWRGLYIRGTVVDPDGRTVNGAFVAAMGVAVMANDTARHGSFTIGPLPPGEYEVNASTFLEDFADPEPVTVPAGTEGLVLKMRRGGVVSVVVVDSRGSPAPDALVWIFEEGGSGEADLGSYTDDEGKLEFNGVLPGFYTLCASTPAGESDAAHGVTPAQGPGGAPVELRLQPAARLRFRVSPAQGGLNAELLKDGLPIGFAPLDQEPFAVVPAGEIEVELVRWNGTEFETLQRRTVLAVLGQETPVDFDLTPPEK